MVMKAFAGRGILLITLRGAYVGLRSIGQAKQGQVYRLRTTGQVRYMQKSKV